MAGVEAREHPPSSLEGLEQPSETIGGKKNLVTFTSQIDILSCKKQANKNTLCTAKRVIYMFPTMFQKGRNCFLIIVQLITSRPFG